MKPMFNSLTGTVTGRGPNTLYLSTGGVEWEIEVSGNTLRRLATEESVRVYTHLHHREDQMRLYGFASVEERHVFMELTRVSGIGPRAAIKILSSAAPDSLIRMLEAEDVDGLSSLPGIGKKTSQKIILALRGKLVAGGGPRGGVHAEIIDGLMEMGFDKTRVAAVVNALASELEETPPEQRENEIFRLAIIRLSTE
jgi:Holliday junction DNA helicase RuvA